MLLHLACFVVLAQDQGPYPEMPPGTPPVLDVPDAKAEKPEDMKRYTEHIPGTEASFELVPIPGGRFLMGSPEDEAGRDASEGPQHEVEVSPFWMAVHEVTWDEYQPFMYKLDRKLRESGRTKTVEQDKWADAVSRPTPPYMPMDFEMGVEGFPAICMTQLAAKQYTKWLSLKTGRFYRLPTEAEWEYACRAGTTTAYSFGDGAIDDYVWHVDDSDDEYHPVATKKPNPWGLFDMHGNVAEWVLDRLDDSFYAAFGDKLVKDPIAWPKELYPRVVRGGSWDQEADECRSASRQGSSEDWKIQDPQLPKSIWYHTDAIHVGFRVVRPFAEPSPEEKERYWGPDLDSVQKILEKQRRGER